MIQTIAELEAWLKPREAYVELEPLGDGTWRAQIECFTKPDVGQNDVSLVTALNRAVEEWEKTPFDFDFES